MLNINEEVHPASAATAPCNPWVAQLLELCDSLVVHLDDVITGNAQAMGLPAPGRLRFCRHPEGGTTACESGFRADRALGVIYGTTDDGVWLPRALAQLGRCSYCSKPVPSNAAARARADRPTRHLVGGAR